MQTGREKLEAIKLKHLPKGSDAWATCGDKTLLEITRAKLLRFLLHSEEKLDPIKDYDHPDPDDVEDAILYICQLLDRYNPPPPVWELHPSRVVGGPGTDIMDYRGTSPRLSLRQPPWPDGFSNDT